MPTRLTNRPRHPRPPPCARVSMLTTLATAGADPPLSRADGRVRPVPFNTARPTLSEATRTALRLCRAEYLSESEAAALLPAPARSAAEVAAEREAAQQAMDVAAAAEAARVAATAAAAEAAAQARAEAEAEAAALPCELHDAAAAGDAERVAALLADGADPTSTHIKVRPGCWRGTAMSFPRESPLSPDCHPPGRLIAIRLAA